MTSIPLSAYEGNEPYIFISYSHDDSDTVFPIIRDLQERGFRVWYDAGIEVGTEWPEYIAEHIYNADCVICFISKTALDSPNCRREINFAIELKKKMFAAYLEKVVLTLGMRMQLNTIQAVHANKHRTRDSFLNALANAELLTVCKGEKPTDIDTEPEDPTYLYELGVKYMNGDGVEQSFEKAAELYEKAAALGLAEAQKELAVCYHCGFGVLPSSETAAYWYQKAADQGHIDATCSLASCYQFGDGVKEDAKKAAELYEKAAVAGHSDAQRLLGDCYLHGNGVAQDYYEAVKWYSKAIVSGSKHAIYDLGLCYFDHYGYQLAPCDDERAFECFSLSAETDGYPPAFYMLGICFEHGYGTAKSLEKAKEMYQISAEYCLDAKEALKRLQLT